MAGKKLPVNVEAEKAALSCALVHPDDVLPIYNRMGLLPDYFTGDRRVFYERMVGLAQDNTTVDPVTLGKEFKELVAELGAVPSTDTPQAARDYAQEVITYALRRQRILDARQSANEAYSNKPLPHIIGMTQRALDKVRNAYAKLTHREMENPADILARENGWSVRFGIPWMDERIRLVSGRVHGLGADPNMGKSTVSIWTTSFNALKGVSSALFIAEDDELDPMLTALSQLGRRVDMAFVNRIRFDPAFNTERNREIVRKMWDEHFADIPLTITKIPGGVDDMLSAVDALHGQHFVVIDHAYAVVGQGTGRAGEDYKEYRRFYNELDLLASKHNHVILVCNQFKISERAGKMVKRGLDAQFGGSGVANILVTSIHMWKPDSEYTLPPSGWQLVVVECVKGKARMVVDEETGLVKDMMDGLGIMYIQQKHRTLSDSPLHPLYLPVKAQDERPILFD